MLVGNVNWLTEELPGKVRQLIIEGRDQPAGSSLMSPCAVAATPLWWRRVHYPTDGSPWWDSIGCLMHEAASLADTPDIKGSRQRKNPSRGVRRHSNRVSTRARSREERAEAFLTGYHGLIDCADRTQEDMGKSMDAGKPWNRRCTVHCSITWIMRENSRIMLIADCRSAQAQPEYTLCRVGHRLRRQHDEAGVVAGQMQAAQLLLE